MRLEGTCSMIKKILVLGANGFIGRNLIEYLEKNNDHYEIHAPARSEFDISDEHAVKVELSKHFYDVVIHAAVYNPRTSQNSQFGELEKNLRMFYNLQRYHELFGKMIYFGSGAEFDKRDEIQMVSDEAFGNGIPLTDYGLYKYIINQSINTSGNIYNLRVFGLFGKYENWRKTFISGACCKAIKNLPITIKQNVYFDYLYVDDFCKIVQWFVDNDTMHKKYNLTSGKCIDLISLASCIKKKSGQEIPIYICKEGLANEYSASNQRLISDIGGFEFTPIENAISDLYEWYKSNEEIIDIYPLLYQE